MITFDCTSEYILQNDIVCLRPLTFEDQQHILPFSLSEPEIWRLSIDSPIGESGVLHYVEKALKARTAGCEYPFIVFDKRSGKYAGSTRLYDIQREHHTVQLGYTWYGKEFQGTGLNKNCKFLLLEFIFDILEFDRLEFQADAQNSRSIAAMKSIGCKEEGILRSHLIKPDGTRRDSIVLSILRCEWQSHLRDILYAKIKAK